MALNGEGEPQPDRRGFHSRYPAPTIVSMSGGRKARLLRRTLVVTQVALVAPGPQVLVSRRLDQLRRAPPEPDSVRRLA